MDNVRFRMWMLILTAGLAAVTGCRDHYPHAVTAAGGDVLPMHAKPAEGGYYQNWDPFAASVEIKPVESVNPVKTQHVLVATVKDKEGKPLPNRRVEWIIPEGSVGTIVEVDESGWRASRGHKVTNQYAISHTNNGDHVLTRGNKDPSDDVYLKRGQSWCVITSTIEGTTDVIAYVPAIYDWHKHKVVARKHWYDVRVTMPPDATNTVGTLHRMVTTTVRFTDGSPLAGHMVTYRIASGPPARFSPGGGQMITVRTGAAGAAPVTLEQVQPAEGVNEIGIEVVRPATLTANRQAIVLAQGLARKTWIGPRIAIVKSAPAQVRVGETFRYAVTVSNPSQVAAQNLTLTDDLPDGIAYIASRPEGTVVGGRSLSWSMDTLPAGQRSDVVIEARAERTGRFTNMASVVASMGLSGRASAVTVATEPRLSVSKQGPSEVLICEPIRYVFTVTNHGDAPATNVKLMDKLPEGLIWMGTHKTVTADFGTLSPSEAKKVEYEVMAQRPGEYVNAAAVTADGGLRAEASVRTVVRQPVLSVSKTGREFQFVGRPLTYTITVANSGDGPARDTYLTDTLPAGADFISASDGGRPAGGSVTWTLGTIAPGQSRQVTVTLRPRQIGQIRNAATAKARCSEASGEAVTAIKGISAILVECGDTEDPIQLGTNETYVITVTNQGTAEGTNLVVKCTLPPEEQFVSASGPTRETVVGNDVAFEPLRSLPAGAKATYRVVAKGVKAGDVRFKVAITSEQIKTPVEETESTNIYE